MAAFQMGAFTDETGVVPMRYKAKMREYMKLNQFSELMGLDELQTQAASRENSFFDRGIAPEITALDDHLIHAEEHTRFALQMAFHMLKMKKPEWAAVMENHIAEHNNQLAAAQPPGEAVMTQ
jgi:hypothetical protein